MASVGHKWPWYCVLKSGGTGTVPVLAVQTDAGVPVAAAAFESGVCRWRLLVVFASRSPFV